MLVRKIEEQINKWIDDSEKALLLSGARQVGKTYIIRKCLKNKGCDFVEFNLIKQPEVVKLIAESTSIDDLILKLSLYSSTKIVPYKTIIFFDEIQKYKEIVTKIKFLVEDKRFRYVLSGSLLGVEIVNLKSAPVGYLQSLNMYPLDFEEFLQIFHVTDDIKKVLKKAFVERTKVDDIIHNKLMEMFRLYLIIGGMPSAVEKYVETNNIDDVITEHSSIIEQYKLDFTQYEEENKKLKISRIYEMMPSELNEKNKRFMVSNMGDKFRIEKIEDSFVWLIKAGVAIPVYNVTEPTVPLKMNVKSSLFKFFISDVGLLTTMYGKTTKLKIVNKEKNVNYGAVYENVVAQELSAHGFEGYYYNSKKLGELDFVVEYHDEVLPIEVKSGKDYEKHSALNNVMKIKNYGLNQAFVFSDHNVETKGNIVYYPVYMTMFLLKDDLEVKLPSPKNLSF
ncbi:MAG TPA: AAA family ATPase [Firmicutes bacterium]|nr:AAA family ATPase [Bacillota bacterium]